MTFFVGELSDENHIGAKKKHIFHNREIEKNSKGIDNEIQVFPTMSSELTIFLFACILTGIKSSK